MNIVFLHAVCENVLVVESKFGYENKLSKMMTVLVTSFG